MKGIIYFAIVSAMLLLSSCSNDQNLIEVSENQQEEKEFVTLGNLSIVETRSSSEETKILNFENSDGTIGLSVSIKPVDKNKYLCDVNNDGTDDFYVKTQHSETLENENKCVLVYEDINSKPLQEVCINISGNQAELNVLKIYEQSKTRALWGGGKESWDDCFSRRMGSPVCITLMIGAGFVGPIGSLGVGIGGALSCAIYNPF